MNSPDRTTPLGWFRENRAALLGFVVIIAMWWLAIRIFDINRFILPDPFDVMASFWRGVTAPIGSRSSMLFQLLFSLRAAGLGLLFGCVIGILMGALAGYSRLVDVAISPYIFAVQGLPKIAIAPLLFIWFGFGLPTKAILSAFLVFFPMYINTYTGFRVIQRDYERLFQIMGATPLQTLRYLRLPNALVLILAGLEIAVVQAILGALVGEFVAANSGIGITLVLYQAVNNTTAMFAALILLALTGIFFNKLVRILRSRVIYWKPLIGGEDG